MNARTLLMVVFVAFGLLVDRCAASEPCGQAGNRGDSAGRPLAGCCQVRGCGCPNDYCPKALPGIPCVPCCRLPDDYCCKALPCVPCPVACCCADDYCPKKPPVCLPPRCDSSYMCGPPDRCCNSISAAATPAKTTQRTPALRSNATSAPTASATLGTSHGTPRPNRIVTDGSSPTNEASMPDMQRLK